MKSILLIGAFERDNFGDALMYLITSKILKDKGYQVVPASIMLAENAQIGFDYIYSYDYLLHTELYDAIWIVGGELGGVDIAMALSMSCDKVPSLHNRRIFQIPRDDASFAYIPNLSKYSLNSNSKLLLNSVGLSNPSDDSELNVSLSDKDINPTFISVRDNLSYELTNIFPHSLAPDIVHTLPSIYNINRECSYYPYIAFQINSILCNNYGVENVAIELLKIAKHYTYRVKLVPTGLALCHDSLDQCNRITDILNLAGVYTEVHKDRDPLSIAKVVADSSLWIGSSLHGRIIAIIYNVPRISLKSTKVSNYVSCWDSSHPCEVGIYSLIQAAEISFSVKDSTNQLGSELSSLALNNFEHIVNTYLN